MRFQREDKKWKVHRLAVETGISHSMIKKYENGETQPGIENLTLIADKLEVSLDTLVHGKSHEQSENDDGLALTLTNAIELVKGVYELSAGARSDLLKIVHFLSTSPEGIKHFQGLLNTVLFKTVDDPEKNKVQK